MLADAAPHASAVPGRPGRILVSTGPPRSTSATERPVGLAHELALTSATAAAGTQLAFHQHAVLDRVAALRSPPVNSVRAKAVAWLAVALLTTGAAGDATLAFGRIAAAGTGLSLQTQHACAQVRKPRRTRARV